MNGIRLCSTDRNADLSSSRKMSTVPMVMPQTVKCATSPRIASSASWQDWILSVFSFNVFNDGWFFATNSFIFPISIVMCSSKVASSCSTP